MEGVFLVVKKVISFLLRMVVSRWVVAVLAGWAVCLILAHSSMAGLFGASLPKGKELEDPYLVQLFAPEFPYESIKVIETKEGKRYVVIKARKSIEDSAWNDYRFKTLGARNIVYFGWGSEFTKALLKSELTIYRFPSERPYVVEYSQVEGEPLSDKPWAPVESVLRRDGSYIVVLVSREFGRVFKRFVLYPEEDAPCPDPPFVGRYPNSKRLACYDDGDRIVFVYVTPDSKEAVFDYYRPLLKAHYESVGFCYWEFEISGKSNVEAYGISQGYKRLPEVPEMLGHKGGKRMESIEMIGRSMIFGIRVADVTSAPAMKRHCLITVKVGINEKYIADLVDSRKRYCKDN